MTIQHTKPKIFIILPFIETVCQPDIIISSVNDIVSFSLSNPLTHFLNHFFVAFNSAAFFSPGILLKNPGLA